MFVSVIECYLVLVSVHESVIFIVCHSALAGLVLGNSRLSMMRN